MTYVKSALCSSETLKGSGRSWTTASYTSVSRTRPIMETLLHNSTPLRSPQWRFHPNKILLLPKVLLSLSIRRRRTLFSSYRIQRSFSTCQQHLPLQLLLLHIIPSHTNDFHNVSSVKQNHREPGGTTKPHLNFFLLSTNSDLLFYAR